MNGASVTGRRKPTKPKKQARVQKRKRDDVDVEKLQKAVDELDTTTKSAKFTDLPLSEPTKAGLKAAHFSDLTDIQARAISVGLKGSDILGAARTGSGKTLAFIVPVLENLYRSQCVGVDAGLGAMIIAPTRELAVQIFDVLYKIGKHGHLFAAGLIIGGKGLKEEQQALARMNIVVCTPGRMLQHLSQTAAFSVDNLQMLVLDEADRILDMGFQRDVDAIIDYLPPERQTLLFSATQTKRVSDLARLSLRDPEYISVHESAASATPKNLQQNYVITPLPAKLDTLWSFIQSSKKTKMLVFLSSGKQVRFVYEAFRKMQPGIPLLHLHGRQKQIARLEITTRFAAAKHSCLFATDVAARGLDFPAVDWVVQVDCPEDADTYIHRAGRTARYERDGRAVLFLDPSEEEGMLERLATKKVPVERINVRAKKQSSIKNQLQGMCFKDPELKYLGQKAFASYVRSIYIQKDKAIFHIQKYDLEEFASSLGLPGAPRIKFMKGDAEAAKKLKNRSRQQMAAERADSSSEESDFDNSDEEVRQEKEKAKQQPTKVRTKYDRMFERRNQDILSSHYSRMKAEEKDEDFGSSSSNDSDGDSDNDRDHSRSKTSGAYTTGDHDFNGTDLPSDPRTGSNYQDDDLFTIKRRIIPAAEPLPPSASTSPSQTLLPTPNHDHDLDSTSNIPPVSQSQLGVQDEDSSQTLALKVDSNRRKTQLQSRAKAAKLLYSLKDPSIQKQKHFKFDDEGGVYDASEPMFEDEVSGVGKDVVEREERRREFVEREGEKMRNIDVEDKAVDKARRRAKRDKLKEKMREGAGAGAGASADADADEGLPMQLKPFEELADLYSDLSDDARIDRADRFEEKSKAEKQTKKQKIKHSSTADDRYNRDGYSSLVSDGDDDYDQKGGAREYSGRTLEELEKIAAGLLN